MTTSHDLKNAGLKATLPRLRIINLFEQSKVRHLTAEDVYKLHPAAAHRIAGRANGIAPTIPVAHGDSRRLKSANRNPSSHSAPKYTIAPAPITSARRPTFAHKRAVVQNSSAPALHHSTAPSAKSAIATRPRNHPQPGSGA